MKPQSAIGSVESCLHNVLKAVRLVKMLAQLQEDVPFVSGTKQQSRTTSRKVRPGG